MLVKEDKTSAACLLSWSSICGRDYYYTDCCWVGAILKLFIETLKNLCRFVDVHEPFLFDLNYSVGMMLLNCPKYSQDISAQKKYVNETVNK